MTLPQNYSDTSSFDTVVMNYFIDTSVRHASANHFMKLLNYSSLKQRILPSVILTSKIAHQEVSPTSKIAHQEVSSIFGDVG